MPPRPKKQNATTISLLEFLDKNLPEDYSLKTQPHSLGYLPASAALPSIECNQPGVKIGTLLQTPYSRTALITIEPHAVHGPVTNGPRKVIGQVHKAGSAMTRGIALAINDSFVTRLTPDTSFFIEPLEIYALSNLEYVQTVPSKAIHTSAQNRQRFLSLNSPNKLVRPFFIQGKTMTEDRNSGDPLADLEPPSLLDSFLQIPTIPHASANDLLSDIPLNDELPGIEDDNNQPPDRISPGVDSHDYNPVPATVETPGVKTWDPTTSTARPTHSLYRGEYLPAPLPEEALQCVAFIAESEKAHRWVISSESKDSLPWTPVASLEEAQPCAPPVESSPPKSQEVSGAAPPESGERDLVTEAHPNLGLPAEGINDALVATSVVIDPVTGAEKNFRNLEGSGIGEDSNVGKRDSALSSAAIVISGGIVEGSLNDSTNGFGQGNGFSNTYPCEPAGKLACVQESDREIENKIAMQRVLELCSNLSLELTQLDLNCSEMIRPAIFAGTTSMQKFLIESRSNWTLNDEGVMLDLLRVLEGFVEVSESTVFRDTSVLKCKRLEKVLLLSKKRFNEQTELIQKLRQKLLEVNECLASRDADVCFRDRLLATKEKELALKEKEIALKAKQIEAKDSELIARASLVPTLEDFVEKRTEIVHSLKVDDEFWAYCRGRGCGWHLHSKLPIYHPACDVPARSSLVLTEELRVSRVAYEKLNQELIAERMFRLDTETNRARTAPIIPVMIDPKPAESEQVKRLTTELQEMRRRLVSVSKKLSTLKDAAGQVEIGAALMGPVDDGPIGSPREDTDLLGKLRELFREKMESVSKLEDELRNALSNSRDDGFEEAAKWKRKYELLAKQYEEALASEGIDMEGNQTPMEHKIYLRNTLIHFLQSDPIGGPEHEGLIPVLMRLMKLST